MPPRLRRFQTYVEWLMAALVVGGLARALAIFLHEGRLPRPFQSNSAEALMDLYNTAYWANRPGAYDVWHSVYPPLSFVFLRIFTHAQCYAGGPYAGRACDPLAAWTIAGVFALNVVLVLWALRRYGAARATPRTIALCGGASMLYGLELANLIIPCFTVFVLAQGHVLRRRSWRQVCRALAINFKPYLLLLALPPLIRRRWRWLIVLAATGLAIYLVTAVLQGGGTPWAILRNFYFYTLSLPDKFGVNNHLADIAARSGDLWRRTMPGPIRAVELAMIGCFIGGAIWPRAVDPRRFTAMALSLLSSEAAIHTQGYSADYTLIFLLFTIFLSPGAAGGRAFAPVVLICAYLLCIPLDLTLIPVATATTQGYFAGRPVMAEFGLNLGQFARPVLLMAIQLVMVIKSARAIGAAAQQRVGDGISRS